MGRPKKLLSELTDFGGNYKDINKKYWKTYNYLKMLSDENIYFRGCEEFKKYEKWQDFREYFPYPEDIDVLFNELEKFDFENSFVSK